MVKDPGVVENFVGDDNGRAIKLFWENFLSYVLDLRELLEWRSSSNELWSNLKPIAQFLAIIWYS